MVFNLFSYFICKYIYFKSAVVFQYTKITQAKYETCQYNNDLWSSSMFLHILATFHTQKVSLRI